MCRNNALIFEKGTATGSSSSFSSCFGNVCSFHRLRVSLKDVLASFIVFRPVFFYVCIVLIKNWILWSIYVGESQKLTGFGLLHVASLAVSFQYIFHPCSLRIKYCEVERTFKHLQRFFGSLYHSPSALNPNSEAFHSPVNKPFCSSNPSHRYVFILYGSIMRYLYYVFARNRVHLDFDVIEHLQIRHFPSIQSLDNLNLFQIFPELCVWCLFQNLIHSSNDHPELLLQFLSFYHMSSAWKYFSRSVLSPHRPTASYWTGTMNEQRWREAT